MCISISRFNKENIQPSRRSGRISAGLWGWMAACGPGELIPIDERLTGQQYVEILDEVLIPSVRKLLLPGHLPVYLVMDNSSVHNSKVVSEWFAEQNNVIRIDWPAKSPDLNPIENLWGQMVREWDTGTIKTKPALIKHCLSVWESLRPKRGMNNYCQRLVDSMPNRLRAVIDNDGGHTKY